MQAIALIPVRPDAGFHSVRPNAQGPKGPRSLTKGGGGGARGASSGGLRSEGSAVRVGPICSQ